VHLGDDTTIDTGVGVASFVVAGDGVYFVAHDGSGDPVDSPTWGETGVLLYADRDGRVVDTGVITDPAASLRASPDGRYLAAFDMASGEEDGFGTPQAEVVVWDLRKGEEILRSSAGMGDPESDDLAALYSDAGIVVMGLSDRELSVVGATDNLVYDLTTGAIRKLSDEKVIAAATDLYRVSPDREWTILDQGKDRPQIVEGPEGRIDLVGVETEKLKLYGWTAEGELLAVHDAGPKVAMTCVVPSGRCSDLPGTAGQLVIFENEQTGPTGPDLRPEADR